MTTAELRVRIRPLTRWAKNRVRQHGDVFRVVNRSPTMILLGSLGDTFRLIKGRPMEKWKGWFVIGEECEIEGDATEHPYR